MTWLAPLGFLGLISIIVLIIIYIIKPNYQQKIISSTYVWKLSLKYKKKRIPISKLRNLLIFLCQIAILTSCSLILAKPVIEAEDPELLKEKIVIIDGSASMLTDNTFDTRFERAIEQAKEIAAQVIVEEEGKITIVLANEKANTVVSAGPETEIMDVYAALDELLDDGPEEVCTYGDGDIEGAMAIATELLYENPVAEVILLTGTNYIIDTTRVTIIDLSEEEEWNAAILDCRAVLEDNFYSFEIDVACYGRDTSVTIVCTVYGSNLTGETYEFSMPVSCNYDQTATIVFDKDNFDAIYSYDYVHVTFSDDVEDSFLYDNYFYLYGGKKEEVRIQYRSALINSFVSGILMTIRDAVINDWDVNIDEIDSNRKENDGVFITEGYDFYIFEHQMPDKMPTDGVVFLINPDKAPNKSGISLGRPQQSRSDIQLAPGEEHPITEFVAPTGITVTQWTPINSHDGFTELMYCGSDPVVLVKDTMYEKIAVMAFSVHASNLTVRYDFPLMMFNMFNHFFPTTLEKNVFDVYEDITFKSRGPELLVRGADVDEAFDLFPATMNIKTPGMYETSQTLVSGEVVIDQFFVKLAAKQSYITREDTFDVPYVEEKPEPMDFDLLVFFAAALVFFLFAEWILQLKEQF